MDLYQRETTRRLRRNSRTLQDIIHKGIHEAGRDTPIPAKAGRDSRMIHSVASLIRAKSKLLLLESPDTVEIYKLDEPTTRPRLAKDGAYLPAIARKTSSLTSLRGLDLGPLSQSCPYLYDKRRGSFSSVGSQRIGNQMTKQNSMRTRREAKKSNVTVSMTYLGQGRRGSTLELAQDELKVLQQVNGGENICVFKGMVTPGEQFQFTSQRHRGYPFSATFYVNGLMVARISSCCEYRYSPGFQQGKKSCFRLAWLAGGVPCYRCTSLRNKYSSCQQLSNSTKENFMLPLEQSFGNVTKSGNGGLMFPILPKAQSAAVSGDIESCPSSPLFFPAKPEKKAVRRTSKHNKNSVNESSNDEQTFAETKEASEKKKRRKGQKSSQRSKSKVTVNETEKKRRDSEGSKASQGSLVMDKHQDQVVSNGLEQKQCKEPKEQNTNYVQPMQTMQSTPPQQTVLPPQPQQPTQPMKPMAPQQPRHPQNKSSKVNVLSQIEEALTKQKAEKPEEHRSNEKNRAGERHRDFYEECVEMSTALEQGPGKHNWFKANILERCRLQKRLSSGPQSPGSDVELSTESETVEPEEEAEEEEEEEPVPEPDLEAQVEAMITVLKTSAEVEQLVLRNTDLTDDLLLSLAGALKSSSSEVTLLNLNLNLIGPYGAHILLEVMRVKPQIKALHLFGNKFRDHGLLALLNGVAELQEQTAIAAAAYQQAVLLPSEQDVLLQQAMAGLPTDWSSFRIFALVELDIGGNGLGSEGVKLLASYMRHHSHLQYLGLAQTSGADLAAWKELFESLKENMSLTQIILDENNLGDPGVRLLAEVLYVNMNLQQMDLDRNSISDVGGNDIMGALLCRTQFPLRHLSLEENNISAGLMNRIQEQVKCI